MCSNYEKTDIKHVAARREWAGFRKWSRMCCRIMIERLMSPADWQPGRPTAVALRGNVSMHLCMLKMSHV